MELRGRQAIVLGAGVSGRAAARFLAARGARVSLLDDDERALQHPEVVALAKAGVHCTAGASSQEPAGFDLAVVSPGVAVDHPRLQRLRAAGAEVLGEVELAFRFLSAPVLAITGTNGKTTVTELLGEILRAAGHRVFVGGNLGTPLVEAVGHEWDFAVAEISSFQLETTQGFRPRVAVLLNVTDDHFDRHRNLQEYAGAKSRIFANQGQGDAAVVNADDPTAWEAGRGTRGVLLPYSTERHRGVGAWLEKGDAVFLLPGRDGIRVPVGTFSLPGRFNLGNALAACLAAAWVGVDPANAWEVARGFRGMRHRLEHFLEWRDVRFVDDSKGTNVGAARAALETVRPPVVWVAGGVDKGGDYTPLIEPLRRVARKIVLVGAAAERLAQALAGAAPIEVAETWEEAVHTAVAAARPGDTVLLSPACSSFDYFRNYAERGDTFQRLCREETGRVGDE